MMLALAEVLPLAQPATRWLAEGGGDSSVPEGIGLFVSPWSELILSAICLVIIAIAVAKFGVPRYLKVLDQRAEKIEGGLNRAEAAEAEIAEIRAGLTAEKEAARTEAARLRDEAKADAAAIVSEAHAKAKAETAAILAAAQRQIDSEKRSAEIALRQDVGSLATDLAERIVGEALRDTALSARVVDRFLAELDAAEASAPASKE